MITEVKAYQTTRGDKYFTRIEAEYNELRDEFFEFYKTSSTIPYVSSNDIFEYLETYSQTILTLVKRIIELQKENQNES